MRAAAQLLDYLEAGNVLDSLAERHGRETVLAKPHVVGRLSSAALRSIIGKASVDDTCAAAQATTQPDYLRHLWNTDKRLTVRRTVARNQHTDGHLRKHIATHTDDAETLEALLLTIPQEEILPLLVDSGNSLWTRGPKERDIVAKAAKALKDHPPEFWPDITCSLASGSSISAAALRTAELTENTLLVIGHSIAAGSPQDKVVRSAIVTALENSGPAALRRAWEELQWPEALKALMRVGGETVDLGLARQALTTEEILTACARNVKRLNDDLLDLLWNAGHDYLRAFGTVELTNEQVQRLWAAAESLPPARKALGRRWVWECSNAKQRVTLIEKHGNDATSLGRLTLRMFNELVEAGLDTRHESAWQMISPPAGYEWENFPAARRALIDHGPINRHPRVKTTEQETHLLLQRAQHDGGIAEWLVRSLNGSELNHHDKALLLAAWARDEVTTQRREWPAWVGPDDIENVRNLNAGSAQRLQQYVASCAYHAGGGNIGNLLVPDIALDWAKVQHPHVWQCAHQHLWGELGDNAELWNTAAALLDTWQGTIRELIRFTRSVH